jgi:hypothetical protein
MSRGKETLKVEVEETTEGEQRTVRVTVTAPARDFLLPDLLSSRGAMRSYEATLKQSVKEMTEDYLAAAEGLIAGIATSHKQEHKDEPPVPKSKHYGNGQGTAPGSAKRANAIVEKNAPAAEIGMTRPQVRASVTDD